MRRKALFCVALAVLCSYAVADTVSIDLPTNAAHETEQAKHTVVMMYEPQLSNEFADVIHPYAFSHKMPDPHYDEHLNAYNIAEPSALSSFVETQTHIKAHSQHASTLKVAAEAEGWRRKPPTYNKKGYSTKLGFKKANNPATPNLPKKLKPLDSDFLTVDRTVAYRRGSYGFRRRRIPNFGSFNPFRSLNPWHRPNSFVNMPNDMFGLSSTMAAIHNPRIFDMGRARAGMLPFARVSSFTDNGAAPSLSSQSGSSSGSSSGSAGPAGGAPAPPSLPAMPFMLDVFSDGFSGFRNGGYRQSLADFGGGFGGGFGGPYGNLSPVSPYIPGDDYRFRDFYGGGGGGSSESSF